MKLLIILAVVTTLTVAAPTSVESDGDAIVSLHFLCSSNVPPCCVQAYLQQFGYMSKRRSASLMTADSFRTFVTEFQQFAGLPQTGELDTATKRMMNTPRCGVKDVELDEKHRRKAHTFNTFYR